MNPNDDQKPIIEETPPTSGPPLEPDQEEKYKKILDEYTKNLQPADLNPQSPPPQTLINQPEHDLQSQSESDSSFQTEESFQLEQPIQNDSPPSYDAPKPSDYIPPSPQLSPTPDEFSHQIPPQYQSPQETSAQDDLSSLDTTSSQVVNPPPPISPSVSTDNIPTPPKKSNFFKYLFILSTLVFVVIVILLVKDYLKLQQLTQDTSLIQPVTEIEPSPVPQTSQQKCLVNDEYLAIGQSFPAEDGCNSCQCQLVDDQPKIVCSTNDCRQADTSSPSATPIEQDNINNPE